MQHLLHNSLAAPFGKFRTLARADGKLSVEKEADRRWDRSIMRSRFSIHAPVPFLQPYLFRIFGCVAFGACQRPHRSDAVFVVLVGLFSTRMPIMKNTPSTATIPLRTDHQLNW